MNIDEFINKSLSNLDAKGEEIKRKIEAYGARVNTSNMDRILAAYSNLNFMEKKRKEILYNKYIENNVLRGNSERVEELQKLLNSPYETKLENLTVEVDEEVEEFYDDFSDNLYELIKEDFKKTYSESKKEAIKEFVDIPYYNENSLTISDDYFYEAMEERYGDGDIAFSDLIKERKINLKKSLKERIRSIALLELKSNRINTTVGGALSAETDRIKMLVRNEITKIENKARMKSYIDLGFTSYIIKESDDRKVCKQCSEQNDKVYPMSQFEIGKTVPPFHINCRGKIGPNLDEEPPENIINSFTNPSPKVYNAYNEYMTNIIKSYGRDSLDRESLLEIKRKYAVQPIDLAKIMFFVTPIEEGDYDTEDNLNNEEYKAAYERYSEEVKKTGEEPVGIDIFLNTVLPIYTRIQINRDDANSDFFDGFNWYEAELKKDADFFDETPLKYMPEKALLDSIIYAVASIFDFAEKRFVDSVLEEETSIFTDYDNEFSDIASNLADVLINLKGTGSNSSVSKKLPISLKKEVSNEVKKNTLNEVKDAAIETEKKILKKEIKEIVGEAVENAAEATIDEAIEENNNTTDKEEHKEEIKKEIEEKIKGLVEKAAEIVIEAKNNYNGIKKVKELNNATDYTNLYGTKFRVPKQSLKSIYHSITENLKSTDKGPLIEATVADYIRNNTDLVITDFGNKVKRVPGDILGDIDCATEEYIIEVKASTAAVKLEQLQKYIDIKDEKYFNVSNKKIILYIHEPIDINNRYVAEILEWTKKKGIILINGLDELKEVLK